MYLHSDRILLLDILLCKRDQTSKKHIPTSITSNLLKQKRSVENFAILFYGIQLVYIVLIKSQHTFFNSARRGVLVQHIERDEEWPHEEPNRGKEEAAL